MGARNPLSTMLFAAAILLSAAALGEEPPAAADPFPPDQIEQMVAPIALYPDALIAQMLMASTYPLDVVQADRWLEDHDDLEAEALQSAVDAEEWDASVKSLVFFPSVLTFMSDNLDWTQDLGDAVLAQQDDITDAIQRLRNEADDSGALASNEQQRIEKSGDTIVIQPAEPDVVYVPSYDPTKVYSQSTPPATTYYEDAYADTVSRYEEGYAAGLAAGTPAATSTTGNSGSGLVNFGIGALAGGLLTAAILWDGDDDDRIYYGGRGYYGAPGYWSQPRYWNDNGWRQPNNIRIDRDVNIERGDITVNRGIVGSDIDRDRVSKWEHNPTRRGGVRYRDASTENRFAANRKDAIIDRDTARGRVREGDRGKLQAPDLSQVKREGAASGGLARLDEKRGDGARLEGLKDKAPAARERVQGKAPAATARVQSRAPAAKAKVAAKPKVAAAKKRPVNKAAKRPQVQQIKRSADSASRPAVAKAKVRARPSGGSSAFKAKAKPNVARKASHRGGASRARAGGGKARARRR